VDIIPKNQEQSDEPAIKRKKKKDLPVDTVVGSSVANNVLSRRRSRSKQKDKGKMKAVEDQDVADGQGQAMYTTED
jgi:hypothetical protein